MIWRPNAKRLNASEYGLRPANPHDDGATAASSSGSTRWSCLGADLAWARPAWRWRWQTARRALASDASSGHCYERDEPFPYLPFAEIIESDLAQEASLDDFRRRMGENAAELAQIAPRLRRVFPDIPQPPELPPTQKRRYLIQSVAEALGRATKTRSYLYISRRTSLGPRIYVGALELSGQSRCPTAACNRRALSRRILDDNPARSLLASRPRAGNTCMPASPTRSNGWILAPSSARGRSPDHLLALCLDMRAWIEFGKAPDLAKLEADLREFSKAAAGARVSLWRALSKVQQSLVDFFRGNWVGALSHPQASFRPEPGSSIEGFGASAPNSSPTERKSK